MSMTTATVALAITIISGIEVTGTLQAAEIVMTAGDPLGTSSFNSAGKWSNGLAPTNGNTYRTSYILRTPESASSFTFAGDRLTVDSGGLLGWKTTGTIAVNDLVLNGGTIGHSLVDVTARLFGNLTVTAPSFFDILDVGQRVFVIYSALYGTDNLTIRMLQTTALKQISLLADNSGYTGKLDLRGPGKFGVCAEAGLGGNPEAFATNQLTFEGSTLFLTNSLTLDDPNRGITLNNTLDAPNYIYPGGVIEVTGSATAKVACVISGAGPLTKTGTGQLHLATNNTYTGMTTVQAGTLRLTVGATHVASSVLATGATSVVTGEGVLSNLTVALGAQLMAENSGWAVKQLTVSNDDEIARITLTLSDSATNSPMIRVDGALVKPPFQKVVLAVSTNGLRQAPYQLLSASNLADYAESDFYLYPPWAGELSRTNDLGGGTVLLFTPSPSGSVVFQISDDPGGTTAFNRSAAWSDGLAPSAGKTYVTPAPRLLRTSISASLTFAGMRLFTDGSTLGLKGQSIIPTVTNLTVLNDTLISMGETGGGGNNNLAGMILLYPSAKEHYAMYIKTLDMGRDLHLFSTLTGYGDLLMQGHGNPVYGPSLFIPSSNNLDFFGRVRVDGNTNVWLRISGEENLGGNPPLFRANQLSFNGGGISVTNSVILDDVNRGILLLATGGFSSTDSSPGGFPSGTTNALLRYEGGCTFRPETGTTMTINCPITGPGALTKKGLGKLVLGGENSYTGLTTVATGAVCPASPHAFGTSPVIFLPGTTLQRRYSDTTLTNGVEFGSSITFEAGSTIQLIFDGEAVYRGAIVMPLFLLPPGYTIDLNTLSVSYSLPNYRLRVISELIGSGPTARELVSAKLTLSGTLIKIH